MVLPGTQGRLGRERLLDASLWRQQRNLWRTGVVTSAWPVLSSEEVQAYRGP